MIDALGGTHTSSSSVARTHTSSSSVAGPTPFHRARSWHPRDGRNVRRGWLSTTWHIYDNNGSFNGWFDGLPEWMRVGSWAPMTFILIFILYGSLLFCPPDPLAFAPTPTTDGWWWADVFGVRGGCAPRVLIFRGVIKTDYQLLYLRPSDLTPPPASRPQSLYGAWLWLSRARGT